MTRQHFARPRFQRVPTKVPVIWQLSPVSNWPMMAAVKVSIASDAVNDPLPLVVSH